MTSPSAPLPLIPSGLLAMPPIVVAQIALLMRAPSRPAGTTAATARAR